MGSDRPELLALVPDRVGPSLQARLDLRRTSVGGQIQIEVGPATVDEQIADRAADQIQLVPRCAKPLGDRVELAQDGGESLGDHTASVLGPAAAAPVRSIGAFSTSGGRTVTTGVSRRTERIKATKHNHVLLAVKRFLATDIFLLISHLRGVLGIPLAEERQAFGDDFHSRVENIRFGVFLLLILECCDTVNDRVGPQTAGAFRNPAPDGKCHPTH